MSYPALLSLAYQMSKAGGQTYSLLEVVVSVGVFLGSVLLGRFGSVGAMRTVGIGLFITGAFSLVIATGPALLVIVGALFIASIGNPIYAVANQTALLEAADRTSRGSVMATRFGLVQTAIIIGAAAGGVLTKYTNPEDTYGVLGVGLMILALYALAAGRSTTNPLHGAAYEAQAKP